MWVVSETRQAKAVRAIRNAESLGLCGRGFKNEEGTSEEVVEGFLIGDRWESWRIEEKT